MSQEQLQTRVASWLERARAVKIADTNGYRETGYIRQEIRSLRAEVATAFDGTIAAAHQTHQTALAEKKRYDGPLAEAERILKNAMDAYLAAEERARQAEIRRREEEARAKAEEQRAKLQAALAKDDIDRALEVAAAPLLVPRVVAPPPSLKVEGIGTRRTRRVVVVDKQALINHCAKVPADSHFLQADISNLTSRWRQQGDAFSVAGVEVHEDISTSAKG
jgi:hypothetical protein